MFLGIGRFVPGHLQTACPVLEPFSVLCLYIYISNYIYMYAWQGYFEMLDSSQSACNIGGFLIVWVHVDTQVEMHEVLQQRRFLE